MNFAKWHACIDIKLKAFLSIITESIECIADWSCPDYLACGEDGHCFNPCPACSANANCETSNHTSVCICNQGYEGCNAYGMLNLFINSSISQLLHLIL